MVFIDRGNEDHKSTGRRAHLQAPGNLNYSGNLSNNGHANGNNDDDVFNREGDGGMRVGKSYQAVIPGIIPKKDRKPENCVERALLVWSPTTDISDAKLDEYVSLAKEKYGYNAEQALGMLFWHKHDLEKAILDLSNFTPFPDEWSVEDKVLFEQAFQFHGKSFHRIRQMLPDKSIASLVKYYYSWKKTRSRTSLIDRQAKRLASQREDGSEVNSEIGSNSDSDSDDKQEGKWHIHRGIHRESCSPTQSLQSQEKEGNGSNGCSNCGISCLQANTSQKGQLCGTCYHYWRKTGSSRPTFGAIRARDGRERRKFRKPPKGMYICHEDLSAVASGSSGQGDAILKHIDDEIINLKRQVQNNKQILSTMKRNFSPNINCFRPNEVSQKLNLKWTNEELLLAVQGVKKHGKDYKMIAEVVGNKTESQLKNFFVTYRKRYNLDAALKEYEEEHGPLPPDDDEDDDDIKIEKIVPGEPAQPPTLSTVSLTNASSPAQAPVSLVKQSTKPA